MLCESNTGISLCSNTFAVFLQTCFPEHEETKDSYDFGIATGGSRTVSSTRGSLGAHLAPHVASKPDFSFQSLDVMSPWKISMGVA